MISYFKKYKTMLNKTLENLFRIIAKYIFVVPVIIIIYGLYTRYGGIVSPLTGSRIPTSTAKDGMQEITNNDILPASPSAVFDLDGPLICHVFTDGGFIDGYVNDGKILIQKEEKTKSNLLLNGDCIYTWENDKFTGEKYCGLQTYVSLFKTFFSGSLTGNSLLGFLEATGGSELNGSQSAQFQDVLQSCRKLEIKDLKIFDIPQNIIFKNLPLEELLE